MGKRLLILICLTGIFLFLGVRFISAQPCPPGGTYCGPYGPCPFPGSAPPHCCTPPCTPALPSCCALPAGPGVPCDGSNPPPSGLCEDYCSNVCNPDTNPGGWDPPTGKVCLCSPTTATSIEGILENIINYIFWFATAITPILIIVGGFYFITSGGNIEKVSTAKRIILFTLIGYTIILFARGLLYFLADILGT